MTPTDPFRAALVQRIEEHQTDRDYYDEHTWTAGHRGAVSLMNEAQHILAMYDQHCGTLTAGEAGAVVSCLHSSWRREYKDNVPLLATCYDCGAQFDPGSPAMMDEWRYVEGIEAIVADSLDLHMVPGDVIPDAARELARAIAALPRPDREKPSADASDAEKCLWMDEMSEQGAVKIVGQWCDKIHAELGDGLSLHATNDIREQVALLVRHCSALRARLAEADREPDVVRWAIRWNDQTDGGVVSDQHMPTKEKAIALKQALETSMPKIGPYRVVRVEATITAETETP